LILTNQTRGVNAPEHTMVDGGIELFDDVRDARAVRSLTVTKQRGSSYVRGRHQYRITDTGINVFPRIEAVLSRVPADSEVTGRTATGIKDFDTMIGGGYPTGSATALIGPSGTGKTTMGLQFLAQSTPEEPGLLFGFYETPGRLRTKARSIGIDIDSLETSGALEILWQPPAENLPDELGHRLLDAVRRRAVKRVFFDGIGALRHAFIFPARVPLFVSAINNTLRASQTTIIYSLELQTLFMPEEISRDELSSMVENVILTYYVKPSKDYASDRSARAVDRELLVLKIRDSAFDAFPEVYHIASTGVRFDDREVGDIRPDETARKGEDT
jgi:circadian clock protein KaiC